MNALPICERLRARLPVCPFADGAPKHTLEEGDPCPVCGDYGDERSKSLCHGADTRIMAEAADTIDDLYEALTELIDLNDAADTCMGGLADCRDGGNGPVQSRELETVIAWSRKALAKARRGQ